MKLLKNVIASIAKQSRVFAVTTGSPRSLSSLAMTVIIMLFISAPATAEEFIYNPDGCEFTITLPGEPYTVRRCLPDNPAKCSTFTSFTHVFGLSATVNVNISCNASDEQTYDLYNDELMKLVLTSMMSNQRITKYDMDFDTPDNIKRGVIFGTGIAGVSETIYTAQIWVGKSSVLTVEGELIGENEGSADEMFSNILKSITQMKLEEVGELTEEDKADVAK